MRSSVGEYGGGFAVGVVGLRCVGELAFRFIAVFGVYDINALAVEADSVDGAARLDQPVVRVGDFVLAAVRRLGEVAGVEDGGRECIEVGHDRVTG